MYRNPFIFDKDNPENDEIDFYNSIIDKHFLKTRILYHKDFPSIDEILPSKKENEILE